MNTWGISAKKRKCKKESERTARETKTVTTEEQGESLQGARGKPKCSPGRIVNLKTDHRVDCADCVFSFIGFSSDFYYLVSSLHFGF